METLCQSKLWAPLWTWSSGARQIAFTVWGRAICLSRGKGAWGPVNFHIESWNESDETFELSNFGSMFRGLAGSTGMYSHGTFWQSSLIELQSGQAEGKYQGISWRPFAKKTSASSWLLKFLFGIHIAVRIVTINLEIKVWRFFNVQIEISYYNLQPCLTMFLSFFIGSSPFCMLSRSLWWPASTPQSSLQAEYHEYLMITYDYLDGELL